MELLKLGDEMTHRFKRGREGKKEREKRDPEREGNKEIET